MLLAFIEALRAMEPQKSPEPGPSTSGFITDPSDICSPEQLSVNVPSQTFSRKRSVLRLPLFQNGKSGKGLLL